MLNIIKGSLVALLYVSVYLVNSTNGKSVKEDDFTAYTENVEFIKKHNKKTDRTFDCGMNKYGNVSLVAFRKHMLGLIVTHLPSDNKYKVKKFLRNANNILPSEFDWSKEGATTSIKDQNMCASSYAFAMVAALEAYLPLWVDHDMIELSPENIIDCTHQKGNKGCKGGFIDATYKFIKKNKGISSLHNYPYTASVRKCKKTSKKYAQIGGYAFLPYGNEYGLQKILYLHGPVVVGIRASLKSMQLYKKGIYYDPKCKGSYINHAVLLVGWGTENGTDYWIIKNSWGKTWGEKGYLRLIRGINHCGIANYASVPTTEYIFR